MPLRYQLLLLSLLTLLLPWAGCRYAREMESTLRDGQEQALLATGSTLANLLASKPDLFGDATSAGTPLDVQAGDLYAHQLTTPALLDGFADDWGLGPDGYSHLVAPGATLKVDYAAAVNEANLYLMLVVSDATPSLEQSNDPAAAPQSRGDHVWLAFDTPGGGSELYLLATPAPGLLSARRPAVSTYGERREIVEPRIQAFWQPLHSGYHLEIRLPRSMVGTHLGFEVVDVSTRTQAPVQLGTIDPTTHQPAGRLVIPSDTLSNALTPLLPSATRVAVADAHGWILAEAGSLGPSSADIYESTDQRAAWLDALYRRVLESGERLPARTRQVDRLSGEPVDSALRGRRAAFWFRLPDERRLLLAAAVPLTGTDAPAGALLLEQAGDRLQTLRSQALTRLLNLTLLASGLAVLASLGFAAILGTRLRRLQRAAETSLARDGRVNAAIPDTAARDELGDVARSLATLLARLNEYTEYLRTLAGKLAHELRTPLAIVRSSLENLESEPDRNGPYLQRAREGTDRLQSILSAMGAASRTEEAIRHAERTRFDLAELVRSTTRAYADAFPAHRFNARVPEGDREFTGAPDLIVQLLDKLVDNAVDFSAPGTLIEVTLEERDALFALAVENEGVPLADEVKARLFESMFHRRPEGPGKPHFGLGLYIVRLIAEFHGGEVFAANLPDRPGVRIGARIRPLA
ncbi:MAG TPA: ATP-binding protein [Steroidobacteraceae bacterium]|nr:ATP-binding protein [Steroidobacteraceae bacterium]